MIDLDIVAILRTAADEYEKVILRNRMLDRDINELRAKYNKDITEIRSNPSPKIHSATVLVDPAKMKEKLKKKLLEPPPEMLVSAISGVSKRASKVLVRASVVRVRDFHRLTLARLAKIKGCGATTIAEIKGLAERCGHTLH